MLSTPPIKGWDGRVTCFSVEPAAIDARGASPRPQPTVAHFRPRPTAPPRAGLTARPIEFSPQQPRAAQMRPAHSRSLTYRSIVFGVNASPYFFHRVLETVTLSPWGRFG